MNIYVKKRIKNFYEMVYGKGTFDNKTDNECQNALNNIKGLIKANTPLLKEKQLQVLELYYDNEFASIKDIAHKVGTRHRQHQQATFFTRARAMPISTTACISATVRRASACFLIPTNCTTSRLLP